MEAARSLVFVGAVLLGVAGALDREGGSFQLLFSAFLPTCFRKRSFRCSIRRDSRIEFVFRERSELLFGAKRLIFLAWTTFLCESAAFVLAAEDSWDLLRGGKKKSHLSHKNLNGPFLDRKSQAAAHRVAQTNISADRLIENGERQTG